MTNLQRLLGKNLKTLRKQADLTQEQLAEQAGISQVFMAEVEGGRKYPSSEVLQKLSDALRVKPFQLFYDEAETKADESIINQKRLMELKREIKKKLTEEIELVFFKFLR